MPPIEHQPPEAPSVVIEKALQDGRDALDEHEAKALLSAYGVPVPKGGLAHSEAEALSLAAAAGRRRCPEGGGPEHPAQDRGTARPSRSA